ncbi:GSCOCG00013344001-RA-CDS [Cotesia congregata]|nr:GSCOCG00013344001-RA-CDS [Cotesia congregata]
MGDKLESHFPTSRHSDNLDIDRENRHRCYWAGCSRTFKKRTDFDSHYRRHTGERPFECEFDGCIKSYVNVSELNRHKKTHYKNPDDDNRKSFKRLNNFKRHTKIHGLKHQCKCEACGVEFDNYMDLRQHLATHQKEFRCPTCGKIYKSNSHLKRHITTHGKKMHKCPRRDCSKIYHQEYQLMDHIKKIHLKERLTCHNCGIQYSNKKSLKAHILRIHLLKN